LVEIILKAGKEKAVRQGHPWIFTGAIAEIKGSAESGDQCIVSSVKGETLGFGYYNALSAIAVRLLSFGSKKFDMSSLEKRISDALQLRKFDNNTTDSYRLINSEGDFLPGLIVDKFGDGIVIQILTSGMERMRHEIIGYLTTICKPTFIYERSDTESRKREGLDESDGLISGSIPENVIAKENGMKFSVDICSGQKTGFFFDQRINRLLIKDYAANRTMCDCFSYSGAFTVNAFAAGVKSSECVDISKNAVEHVRKNVDLNFHDVNLSTVNADVFKYLRETTSVYDLIVLDPPKFAKHPGEVERASRGYKDINLVAMKKIAPEGILFTFSCSNAIDPKLFRQIVFAAAADSGRSVQVLHSMTAGVDHPVNIAHKEGEYLKGLVLRVL
jgi:23S rRNA (cytosine1962-C5)-methyltransferase